MTPTNPNDPENLDDLDAEFTDEELLDAELGEYDDDAGNLDEEWEEPAAAAPVRQKKKFPLFNIIVIGVAVLIGGGILVSMGSKSTSSPEDGVPSQQVSSMPASATTPQAQTPAPDANSLQAIQDSEAPPSDTAVAAPAAPAQGFMNDPTQLDQGSPGAPSLPQNASMTGFASPEAAPGSGPADLPLPQTANTNLPNIDQIKKAAPAPVEASSSATPPAASSLSNDQQTMLVAKLDQVMSRIDSLEKKIAEPPAAAPASNAGEIASLRIAVERLESKVAKMSNTPAVRASSSPSYSDDEASKVVVKKSVPKKRKSSPRVSSTPAASSSAKWELRSARPGEAMVGKAGQAELRTIRIGDSVAGIGEIQSISQMGGSWIVQGTGGSISQ